MQLVLDQPWLRRPVKVTGSRSVFENNAFRWIDANQTAHSHSRFHCSTLPHRYFGCSSYTHTRRAVGPEFMQLTTYISVHDAVDINGFLIATSSRFFSFWTHRHDAAAVQKFSCEL